MCYFSKNVYSLLGYVFFFKFKGFQMQILEKKNEDKLLRYKLGNVCYKKRLRGPFWTVKLFFFNIKFIRNNIGLLMCVDCAFS